MKYRPATLADATTSLLPPAQSTTWTSTSPGPSATHRSFTWPCRLGVALPYASRRSTEKTPGDPTSRSNTASPSKTHPGTTARPGSHVPFITSSSPINTSATSYGPATRTT